MVLIIYNVLEMGKDTVDKYLESMNFLQQKRQNYFKIVPAKI